MGHDFMTILAGVVILGILLAIVGLTGLGAYGLCDHAACNCPADGCDGIPAHNCAVAMDGLLWSIAIAAVWAAITKAVMVLVPSARRRPVDANV
ncbi:MAG: hypothetical protein L3J96_01940 [Thermoplasmata archaeon]|nr:hypothetical protein [Thermoplasmata archaeon]